MTSQAGPVARGIRCEHCGNSIEIIDLAPTIRCSHCEREQPVDPQLLAELRSYRDQVEVQASQARGARKVAAAWDQTTADMERSTKLRGYLIAFGLMGGVPTVTILTGIVLLQAGVIPRESSFVLNFLAMGASLVGVALYYVWYLSRRRLQPSTPRQLETTIRCPECGGPNHIGHGEMTESCVHCGAGLLPGEGIREAVVDAARQERRRATMEKLRAERSGYVSLSKVGMGPVSLILFIGGSFLMMIGGGTAIFSYLMIVGEEPYTPGIFVGWAMTIALVAGMVMAIRLIRLRQARFEKAMQRLGEAFGGQRLDGIAGTARWLNSYWAGPMDPYEMMPGNIYGAAELRLSGYQIFVHANPVAASQYHQAYASVLVACDIPGTDRDDTEQVRSDEQTQKIQHRINEAGFEVEFIEAGIVARALAERLPGLKRPKNIAALSEPIVDLSRLADALGATPIEAIP